jgi:integrase
MHVTELLAAGLPVRSVAQRAGHATPTMTLNVYGHSTAALDRAADILARAARGG